MKPVIALLALFLMSCATVGSPISDNTFSQIRRGETTKDQVVDLLGIPQFVSHTDDGEEMYSYHYSRVVPGAVVDQRFVSVWFGADNIVTKANMMGTPR